MFRNCTSLVGGAGTTYSSLNPADKTYARVDGGTANPGYFTATADLIGRYTFNKLIQKILQRKR